MRKKSRDRTWMVVAGCGLDPKLANALKIPIKAKKYKSGIDKQPYCNERKREAHLQQSSSLRSSDPSAVLFFGVEGTLGSRIFLARQEAALSPQCVFVSPETREEIKKRLYKKINIVDNEIIVVVGFS